MNLDIPFLLLTPYYTHNSFSLSFLYNDLSFILGGFALKVTLGAKMGL